MSNSNFNNQLYKNMHMNQHSVLVFQEEQELLMIKKKICREVNLVRHRYSLPEFYEDHCLSRIMSAASNTTLFTSENLVNLLNHRISPNDIDVLTGMRTISGLAISKTDPMSSIEHLYLDILNQMINVSHKEKFMDKRYNNIALSLKFFNNQANLAVVLSKTILSIESICLESNHYLISGAINNNDYSLFILIIRSKNIEVVVSPNRMSYDVFNQFFKIRVDKDILSQMNLEDIELQFYVKKGKNSVKYSQGDDLTHEDVVKMSPILILAYTMPFIPIESPHVQLKNFLNNQNITPSAQSNKIFNLL
jgi:hypothetical protein